MIKGFMVPVLSQIIDTKTFKVRMDDQKLDSMLRELQAFNKRETSRIAKANLSVQQVTGFSVTNLENLDIKAIEKLNFSLKQLDSIMSLLQKSNTWDAQSVQSMNAIAKILTSILNKEQKEVEFPDVQTVKGSVSIESMPDLPSLQSLSSVVSRLESTLNGFKLDSTGKTMFKDKGIIAAIDSLKEAISSLPQPQEARFPDSISINNFPPQKYPIPSNNININPLRGYAKSSSVTLNATTPLGLPTTALANRRGVVIYNNASSTIYIGGSDVTSSNGMPVPASSYSPALDAGSRLILYGITSSGSANVRVLEVSNDNIGSQ